MTSSWTSLIKDPFRQQLPCEQGDQVRSQFKHFCCERGLLDRIKTLSLEDFLFQLIESEALQRSSGRSSFIQGSIGQVIAKLHFSVELPKPNVSYGMSPH